MLTIVPSGSTTNVVRLAIPAFSFSTPYSFDTFAIMRYMEFFPPDEIIVKDPDILGGTPVFRGTRVPFQALLDYLEGGETLDEFLDDFPTVSKEAAVAALEFAKSLLVGRLG